MKVKITSIVENPLKLLAPHYCYGCKTENTLLCDACQNTVVNNDNLHCYRCLRPMSEQAVCSQCLPKSPFDGFFVSGEYEGVLEALIHAYKFERAKEGAVPLSRLLAGVLPYFDEAVIIHIPTVQSHVRVRGYDHAALIAGQLASHRGWPSRSLLVRRHNKRQLGATRQQRKAQAATAFALKAAAEAPLIVLVDDVTTTGATMDSAAWLLKEAGAKIVIGVTVAQQRLT